MSRLTQNPYIGLTLVQLWETMQRQAGELLGDRPRSRRDMAHLILAAAAKINPHTGLGSPVEAVHAGRRLLTEIYGEVYQAEAAAIRHLILCHAADAIGFGYEQRRRVGSPWREAAVLASGGEDGLLLALAMLEDVRRVGICNTGADTPSEVLSRTHTGKPVSDLASLPS